MKKSIGLLLVCLIVFVSCQSSYEEPHIALDGYKIENGFDLDVIASEPFLDAPVAFDFDSEGRIWVADMPGFMQNVDGKGEDEPSGSIKILEDIDEDGVMDHAKTFLDSLVMPRALALVYGGLLYVEPPKLWFVEINGDQPGKRTLVDSLYAPEGNPEYQPNGLDLNIDNWIYSAETKSRYQLKNGKWLKEPTPQRGQWGISHDNFGRLYFNHNSQQLLGDYVLPNRLVRNKYYVPKHGIKRLLTNDQRVYPLHPTAVNRGYAKGVLDKDSVLINVSAACAPLIYRGGAFPKGYAQNAFVCVPEGNLIKRNILSFYGDSTSAKQAWQGKEFLASTDEGFRPVKLANGPDGALYVADMHRGVIQHYAFLSPYLKKKARKMKLDTLTGYGRILRITSKGEKPSKSPDFDRLSGAELVKLLDNKNGWIRDHAQHYLIFKHQKSVIPELKQLAENSGKPIAQIHALYTLKGLDALSFEMLDNIAQGADAEVVSQVIVLMEEYVSRENAPRAASLFQELLQKNDPEIDLYLASTLGTWAKDSPQTFAPLIGSLFEKKKDSPLFNEALVSGSGQTIQDLMPLLKDNPDFENSDLQRKLSQTLDRQKQNNLNDIYANNAHRMDNRTKGAKLFRQICAACHGLDGKGTEGVAPPFVKSEYLSGRAERVALIVLHGLKGPVHVNGQLYELSQTMPGMAGNASLSDSDISDVVAYVTNAFSRSAKYLSTDKIKKLRELDPEDGGEYTERELLDYLKTLK